MSRTATLVVGAIWLFVSTPAAAEILVGINGGFVIPGDQDLVFKEYSSGGGLNPAQVVSQDKVSESIGPIVGLQATGWGGWSFLRYFGVQGDALYWYMHARGEPSPPAPHFTVSQNRLAFFGSLLARVPVYPLVGRFSPDGTDWFVYGGGGIGPAYSTASHGSSDWNLAYQALGGISVPLSSHLRLRVEGRLLLTGDIDTTPKDGPGWRVDVSGKHSSLFSNPHLDTRFFPVIVGLDWRF